MSHHVSSPTEQVIKTGWYLAELNLVVALHPPGFQSRAYDSEGTGTV